MFISSDISEHIRSRIDAKAPVAAIALPGDDKLRTLRDDEQLVMNTFNALWAERGIIDNHHLQEPLNACPLAGESTRQDEYCRSIQYVIDQINGRTDCKTVISTAICGKAPIDWLKFAESYLAPATHTFRCILYTPQCGLWIIATPELLLHCHGNILSTMALAGTMAAGCDKWDDKNRKEQAIVTNHIVDVLSKCGLNPEVGETHTMTAGNVAHLCTPIQATATSDIQLAPIIDSLSPTPAVCGFPKYEALDAIERYESHSRNLYSGYVGIVSPEETCLFVTLRCIQIDPKTNRYTFYSGGGITALSSPADEWNETRLKAAPALNIINQLQSITNDAKR